MTTIGRMPVCHGGRAAHVRLQHDMDSLHSAQTPTATSQTCLEVERLFQKERFKEAVKQAKLCYRKKARRRIICCSNERTACGLGS